MRPRPSVLIWDAGLYPRRGTSHHRVRRKALSYGPRRSASTLRPRPSLPACAQCCRGATENSYRRSQKRRSFSADDERRKGPFGNPRFDPPLLN
ncbi:hypothetical protein AAFF_G00285290 [Aldrovandia affinis]|uniref:Uncharacterized protein n=1 Tax=Aldrovandia affinis TaxID=143900 RepID=A0AAD7TAC9_9TELE|nr:hypothetical protein AAFF_G00285290 [Aldrovandia affinis]